MPPSSSPQYSPSHKNSSPPPSNPSQHNSKPTHNSSPPPPSPSPPPPPPSPPSPSPPPPSPPPPHNEYNYQPLPPPSPTSSGRNNSPSLPRKNGDNALPSKVPSSDGKMIIGVAAGAGLLVVVAIFFVAKCFLPKKKKGQHNPQFEPQGSEPPPTGGNGCIPPSQMPPTSSGGDHGWNPSPQMPVQIYIGEESDNVSGYLHALPPPPPGIPLALNKNNFTYEELSIATSGFSQSNLIGQGGFGYVHKGVLPDGKEVAIKSLKTGSGQGEREFQSEVEIISRVHHRHLVSLVGYCVAGAQRMLVYDFVPNKTLEYHLHGKDVPVMDFASRLRIALGSAKGLAYLHEDCHPHIIHRDIKAANILIDNNFEAMVADFGLARLSNENETHVSTSVMGTFGYLAPEYASSGKLTEKSDVYSFGIMLLELITGRLPIDNTMEDTLVDWARPLLDRAVETGNHVQLVDPRLERGYDHMQMQRMVVCASASVRHSAKRRPKMSQIVRALQGDTSLDDLNEGLKPTNSSLAS